MIDIVDTHAHLALPDFDSDRDLVVQRAGAAGVRQIISPAIDLPTSRAAVALAHAHACLGAAIGIHPLDVDEWTPEVAETLEQLGRDPRVVAIGETGLDFARGRACEGAQRRALHGHARLARRLGLPLIIHNRGADTEIEQALDEESAERVVLHCFTGDAAFARRAVERGWYLGFGGILTYRNGVALANLLPALPQDRIVVETDAPYLSPDPHRGRRNEPANVVSALQVVAKALHLTLEATATLTTANAHRLFPRLAQTRPLAGS